VKEKKILKMIHTSTHQAKHAHNRSYSIGLLINGISMQITQDPVKRVPLGGCALLEGSHHKYKINERLENIKYSR
jgi:hypothetical protein